MHSVLNKTKGSELFCNCEGVQTVAFSYCIPHVNAVSFFFFFFACTIVLPVKHASLMTPAEFLTQTEHMRAIKKQRWYQNLLWLHDSKATLHSEANQHTQRTSH